MRVADWLGTIGVALLLVAFFPAALFFSAVYSESLFLLLSVGAVLAARQGRWAWAGALAALAALTRNSGVLLLVPLALLFLYLPLLVIAILSFNSATSLSWPPQGLTTSWWVDAWRADGPVVKKSYPEHSTGE